METELACQPIAYLLREEVLKDPKEIDLASQELQIPSWQECCFKDIGKL